MGESRIELAASLGFESSRMQRQYGFKPKKNPIEGSSHEVKEKNKEVRNFYEALSPELKDYFFLFQDEDGLEAVSLRSNPAIRIHENKKDKDGLMYIRVRLNKHNSNDFKLLIESQLLVPPKESYQIDHTVYDFAGIPLMVSQENAMSVVRKINVLAQNNDNLFLVKCLWLLLSCEIKC